MKLFAAMRNGGGALRSIRLRMMGSGGNIGTVSNLIKMHGARKGAGQASPKEHHRRVNKGRYEDGREKTRTAPDCHCRKTLPSVEQVQNFLLQPMIYRTIIDDMRSSISKRTELNKAQIIVRAARAPLGLLPAERILREHLDTIEDWRCLGASWDQIAALLGEAGFRSRRGTVVGADQLRAMVSRIRRGSEGSAVTKIISVITRQHSNPAAGVDAEKIKPESDQVSAFERKDIAERIRRAAALRLRLE